MALVRAKTQADDVPITHTSKIAELIQRRRYQVLVHSLIYYDLDANIIDDHTWMDLANELVDLQKANPEIAEQVIFADAFRDFSGETGMNLPYRDAQIVKIAQRLLKDKDPEAAERVAYLETTPAEYDKYKLKSHKLEKDPPKEVKKVEVQQPRKGLFRVPRT